MFEIGVLLAGLGFLTLILVFQDWLTRHPLLLRRVRTGFLLYTLLFIGWYGLAQLSVINVLTFTLAAMHGFQWESSLIDPMMFILVVRGRDPAAVGARCVLRLAVPVRGAAGTDLPVVSALPGCRVSKSRRWCMSACGH